MNQISLDWIKSIEREPISEGKYYYKYNNIKLVLNFVIIKPKLIDYEVNENFNENMLSEINYWTEDIDSAIFTKSCDELLWLEEKEL